jgi:2-polyprenyl-3-methyl-5-hydroxy-6-metoxy-1,4-benzoquinol methylase
VNRLRSRPGCIGIVLAGLVGLACGKPADPPEVRKDASAHAAIAAGAQRDAEQARFDEERRPDLIIAALGIGPGSQVADVGAGSGLLTMRLARAVAPGGKVVATDIDGGVLDLLQTRMAAAKLTDLVETRVVDSETPGLEPGAYDVILLAEVDHYFADPVAWLVAAKPALKRNGAIAITNRIHHRAAGLAAARAAGLHLVSESTPVPSTFIAVFRTAPLSPKPSR